MAGDNHYRNSGSKGVINAKFDDDSLALNKTCLEKKKKNTHTIGKYYYLQLEEEVVILVKYFIHSYVLTCSML